MKSKSLWLASAAVLTSTLGAQAADLPFRKAAPVEYVRVCDAYGAGFFYIPGTDTCLRVGGQIRAEYTVRGGAPTQNAAAKAFNAAGTAFNRDLSSLRARAYLNTDSRTQTAYGTLRTYLSLRFTDDSTPTGPVGGRGGIANATGVRPSTGLFQGYNGNPAVWIDKGFIQFAGLTAGKAQSFFDFDAQSYEILSNSVANSNQPTNLFAYTATFGGGFSATISVEDASYRRVGDDGQYTTSTGYTGAQLTALGVATVGAFSNNPTSAGGVPTAGVLAYAGQEIPDLVANVRYDAGWGAAQISGAYHQVQSIPTVLLNNAAGAANGGTLSTVQAPSADGFAVQGGIKVNLPMLAKGDSFTLQGTYEEGAMDYINGVNYPGNGLSGVYDKGVNGVGAQYGNNFGVPVNDAFVVARGGNLAVALNRGVGAYGAFRHYFTPEIYGTLFGAYLDISNPIQAQRISASNDSATVWQIGANAIWTPVKDLQIGGEVVYSNVEYRYAAGTNPNYNAVVNGVNNGNATPKNPDDIRGRFTIRRAF